MHERNVEHMKTVPSQIELMNREWDDIAVRNPCYGIFSWPDFQAPACMESAQAPVRLSAGMR